MKFKDHMEPEAYEAMRLRLHDQTAKYHQMTNDAARNGTLDVVRYNAGVQDGLQIALLILEGRNQ